MKIGRSTTTTSGDYTVPRAPDSPTVPRAPDNKDSFKHKNRVLRPTKRVCFSIFTEVYYMDASSTKQAERFHSDIHHKDLDIFQDEPVLDLSIFHRQ